ncbi:MAG: type II 3-dehydroquinate dehydratase [Gammaproteobacteria bacterium]|nr:type II 3-dehydroquinate dehydratase [Gammaproteobacteria bacterium]MDH3856923.1 type II 3-dehydroquinate dehydratase [Gammaproteobacteria bacterium]
MANILVIHGPNLNLLGTREPEVYGTDTLASINKHLAQMAEQNEVRLRTYQSNTEGNIISCIQQAASKDIQFIIINPGAFTHTSIAIRDAFLATRIPFIEVHVSNVYAREDFRAHSYLSDIALGVISGFGRNSYLLAFEAAIIHCNQS